MHELSLCRAIYGLAYRAAGGRRVECVNLDVGELRQVVPETLVYCWALVTEETPLADAKLQVASIPAVLACRACAAQTRMRGIPMLVCSHCGASDVAVVSGEEFLLRSLDLKE